jgi:hypothetical protein
MEQTSSEDEVGTEPRRMGKKSCAWVVGMRLGIKRARLAEGYRDMKERLRTDGCPERAGLVT